MKVDLSAQELNRIMEAISFSINHGFESDKLEALEMKIMAILNQPAKCVHAWILARTYDGYEAICVRCLESPKLHLEDDKKNED